MKIALIQYNPDWENKEANKQKILSMINDIEGVELFVFPEMSSDWFHNEVKRNVRDNSS